MGEGGAGQADAREAGGTLDDVERRADGRQLEGASAVGSGAPAHADVVAESEHQRPVEVLEIVVILQQVPHVSLGRHRGALRVGALEAAQQRIVHQRHHERGQTIPAVAVAATRRESLQRRFDVLVTYGTDVAAALFARMV